MLADQIESVEIGALDEGIQPEASREAVLSMVENGLKEFAAREDCRDIKNERGITNRLCKILGKKCGHGLFFFHHEAMENENDGLSPSVDFAVIASQEVLFEARSYQGESTLASFEAKRLPSPKKPREREYLVGMDKPCGGVERFKRGIHGSRSPVCAMIGYVQEGTALEWHSVINSWVRELIVNGNDASITWDQGDQLEKDGTSGGIQRFISKNTRVVEGVTDILPLRHLWVELRDSAYPGY